MSTAHTLVQRLEAIGSRLENTAPAGISIALAGEGEVRWARGFGREAVAPYEPIDAQTVFLAASLTKPAFAYAALRLCAEGLIELDVPLVNYYPEPYTVSGFNSEEPRLQQVTARQVLSHSAGLGNWEEANQGKISFPPGERFLYSGEGYRFLQRVIEYLTREPLDVLMQRRLLDPLGMARSSVTWRGAWSEDMVEAGSWHPPVPAGDTPAGHALIPDPAEPGCFRRDESRPGPIWSAANAAFSLTTTPTEYAHFLLQILQPGSSHAYGLDDEWVDRMLTPQIRIDDRLSWGLGWGLLETAAGPCFWQWGDMLGRQHFVIGSRWPGYGLVIMTNSPRGLEICAELVAQALDEEHARPIQRVLQSGW